MTEQPSPDGFEDINETVGDEWESETTPYQRVRHVISHTYSPVPAETVAEQARTSPKTARKHLNNLAQEGFVTTTTGEHGGKYYRRSTESLVVEQAADILDHVSTDELTTRIGELHGRLREYRDEYGVDSPEDLVVSHTSEFLSDTNTELSDSEIDAETLRDWRTTRRNLAFANAALSIANAERFVDSDTDPTDDGVSV